eukprot:scaffold7376_cov250-Pinguiococcus_pyrenoidosus.AAC.10
MRFLSKFDLQIAKHDVIPLFYHIQIPTCAPGTFRASALTDKPSRANAHREAFEKSLARSTTA